jgi:hypothetical protein
MTTRVASVTRYYLSNNTTYDSGDLFLGERGVPILAAGDVSGPASKTVTIPLGTFPGTYYIIAVADAGKVVAEISETNNTKYLGVRVLP